MATPAPDAVKRLVDRFDLGRKVFLSGDYKEEQLRIEFGPRTCRLRFLKPFFTALGWDMDNALDTMLAGNCGSIPPFPQVQPTTADGFALLTFPPARPRITPLHEPSPAWTDRESSACSWNAANDPPRNQPGKKMERLSPNDERLVTNDEN